MKRNALIAGVTGLTGSLLVSELIRSDYYNSIFLLVRRPYPISHQKIKVCEVDFNHLDNLNPDAVIHDVFICLGTTMKKAGSRENFKKVDHDYVLAVAAWALNHHAEKLTFISSVGANAQKGSTFYLQIKGQIEESLINLHLPHLTILRPSLLLGNRDEFRLAEKLSSLILKPLSFLFIGKLRRYRPVEARQVARAMAYFQRINTEPVMIVENEMIHKYSSE